VFDYRLRFAQVNLNTMPTPGAAHQPSALPSFSEFLVSPGFAGAAVLIAAVIVLSAVLYASGLTARRLDKQLEQQDLQHEEVRADRQHTEVVDRCWERFVWLVETAGIEPAAREAGEASLGLGPELALELLRGLHRDANELGDQTLARAVAVYLAQYGLVLGQQGGPLPKVADEPDGRVPSSAGDKPSAAATMPIKSRNAAKASTTKVAEQTRTRVRDTIGDHPAGTHRGP
jgi:hypothetical protein